MVTSSLETAASLLSLIWLLNLVLNDGIPNDHSHDDGSRDRSLFQLCLRRR